MTIAGGITTPRRSPSSTAWAAMPRSAWRCTPAGSTSPKPFAAPLQQRPSRRPVADGRGRRARRGARLLPFGPRIAARRPGAGPGRLPLALARPVAQGRDLGRDPGAAADRCRLRSRLPALHGAPAAAGLLSPGHPHLLGRGRRASARSRGASPSARLSAPEGSYTAKLFADPELLAAKLREEAAELAEAETRDAAIHEAADVLYFTLARSPATTSTSPRSSAPSTAAPSRSPGEADPPGTVAASCKLCRLVCRTALLRSYSSHLAGAMTRLVWRGAHPARGSGNRTGRPSARIREAPCSKAARLASTAGQNQIYSSDQKSDRNFKAATATRWSEPQVPGPGFTPSTIGACAARAGVVPAETAFRSAYAVALR